MEMQRVATQLLALLPDVLFRWRQHLRTARGEESGGATLQDQLAGSLVEIFQEVCLAVASSRFDIDKCAAAARQYGEIRFQQCSTPPILSVSSAPTELLREFRLLRQCVWEAARSAFAPTAEVLVEAQSRADMVFDEASAIAIQALLEKIRLRDSEYD